MYNKYIYNIIIKYLEHPISIIFKQSPFFNLGYVPNFKNFNYCFLCKQKKYVKHYLCKIYNRNNNCKYYHIYNSFNPYYKINKKNIKI